MAAYIVTYDLSAPDRNYSGLLELIRSYGTFAQLTESSWVVVTNSDATLVEAYLARALDSNDKLFVGALGPPAAWRGLPLERKAWLEDFLN